MRRSPNRSISIIRTFAVLIAVVVPDRFVVSSFQQVSVLSQSRRSHHDITRSQLSNDVMNESQAQTSSQGEENLSHRAYIEEKLFKNNQSFLEMATESERNASTKLIKKRIKAKKRTRLGTGGGFGGGTSPSSSKKNKPHVDFLPQIDKSGFGAIVLDHGVARIDNCIPKTTTSDLLAYVNSQLETSLAEVSDNSTPQLSRFANVLAKKNRWDMLLPLEESPEIMSALRSLLARGTILGATIESILGPDAELYELASLISDPGSEPQVLHPDFPYQDTLPPALTCFVSLQDILPSMGPTTFLPRSANAAYHEDLKQRLWDLHSTDGVIATAPNVLSCLKAGDVSLYNPMTLHCGGANRSEVRRCLFYFSFRNPVLDPSTEGASLRPELKERGLTLRSLRKVLEK